MVRLDPWAGARWAAHPRRLGPRGYPSSATRTTGEATTVLDRLDHADRPLSGEPPSPQLSASGAESQANWDRRGRLLPYVLRRIVTR